MIVQFVFLSFLTFISVVKIASYLCRGRYRLKCSSEHKEARIASLICSKNDKINKELVEVLKKESDVYILTGGKNKAEAINNWVKKYGKNYDFIGIFDYDSEVEEGFYKKILKYFDRDVAFVQAKIYGKDGFMKEEVQRFFENRIPLCFLSCGHNVVYRADVLLKNPLPETMGEDFLHSIELFKRGYKSVLAEDVKSYEKNPKTLKFIERDIKWSGNEVLFVKKIPDVLKLKIPILKRLEIFSDFLRCIIALIVLSTMLAFRLDIISQIIAIALGAIASRPKTIKSALLLPLITTSAFGFIKGLFTNKKVFVPTSQLNYKKYVTAILALNIIISFIYVFNFINAVFFSLLLITSIVLMIRICTE